MRRKIKIGVLDLFCGCGGASLGFLQANAAHADVSIIAGIDSDPHACATYERMIGAPALQLDIVDLASSSQLLDRLKQSWKLDQYDKVILIGCSPCQGFAAHRMQVSGRDERRNLFIALCKVVTYLRPDGVFIENVPDLLSRRHWQYFCRGKKMLEGAGYHLGGRVYNFATLGLPQERFRMVILAAHSTLAMPEPILAPTDFATVRQAIGHLPRLKSGEQDACDPMHVTSKHRNSTLKILRRIPKDGGSRPKGVGPACLDRVRETSGGYTDVYGRLAWSRPALTITARCRTPSCGRFTHPEQDRGLSVREAALLQGFPSDVVFEGPFDDKFKQIGNAVPPVVAQFFATHLISALTRRDSGISRRKTESDNLAKPFGHGFAIKINAIKQRRVRANQ